MRVRVRVNVLCMLLIVSSELTAFMVWGANLEMEEPGRVVIQGRQFKPDCTTPSSRTEDDAGVQEPGFGAHCSGAVRTLRWSASQYIWKQCS